ncbi:MAG: PAS domain S-box protein [Deltaproteobacteria bacterium]|mgnify:FL=1|nr:PAS domain S-box protein [Deltaproteobacteria bacterium]MBT6500237.1 PAS domain S-box protein [Deltaproteobacteria bacterium]
MFTPIKQRLNSVYSGQGIEIQHRAFFLAGILIVSIFLCLISIVLITAMLDVNLVVLFSGMNLLAIMLAGVLLLIWRGRYRIGILVLCTSFLVAPLIMKFTVVDVTISSSLLGVWLLLPLMINSLFGSHQRETAVIAIIALALILANQYIILPSSESHLTETSLLVFFYFGIIVLLWLYRNSNNLVIRSLRLNTGQDLEELASLRTKNAWLQQASQAGGVACWQMNPDTRQINADKWFWERLGYSDETCPKSFPELLSSFHGSEVDEIIRDLDDILHGNIRSLKKEYRMKTRVGDWIWVSYDACLWGEKEKMLIGTITETTAIRQKEITLEKSKEKYRNLYEKAPVGLFRISTADGQVLECNERVVELFEYEDKNQLIERAFAMGYFMEDEAREQMRQRLVLEGQANNIEARFRRKNGSEFWARCSVRSDDEKGHIEGGLTDITRQKKAEAALFESESQFHDLVDNLLVGISIIQNGRIVFMNPCQLSLMGTQQELIRLDDLQVNPNDSRKFSHLCETVNANQSLPSEIAIGFYPFEKSKDDQNLKYVNVRTKQILYHGLQSMLISMEDITRIKKLEESSQIKEKMVSLGHASLGIAHEIRSPLSGINLLIDGVQENFQDPESAEDIQELLNEVKKASHMIEQVVNRALDFARPSVPKSKLANISDPINEAVKLMQTTMRRFEIEVETKLSKSLPLLYFDGLLIEQVMLSLFSNALRELQGETTQKMIRISTEQVGYEVLIAVEDSGSGVPTELRQSIFSPFFSKDQKGSGIGLSICQRIISNHGGTISATDSSLGGAKFVFSLPVDKREIPR